jgi:hypothetical protein
LEQRLKRSASVGVRHLSAKQQQEDEEEKPKESLKDTVRRMKKEGKASDDDGIDPRLDGFLRNATDTWSSFSAEVGKTWEDLLKSGERKDINKKILHPTDTVEGEKAYTGPVEIMIIDESEHLTAWEKMQKRLTEAPIISGD